MKFVSKTIVVAITDTGDNPRYEYERYELLKPFVYYKKTDGIPELVDPDTTVRYWVDQESAEQFRDGLLALAAKHNETVSVTVESV